jgi:rhodanese-related sulfurtransferase
MTSPNLSIDLATARTEAQAGRAVLIDIREPDEHAQGVAPEAKLIPMSQLGARLNEVPTDPAVPVLFICRTQNRSGAVAHALRERGYEHVSYVVGGMSMWQAHGWATVSPDAKTRS